jgi:maltooligosyltrehalose trehalohydrolase
VKYQHEMPFGAECRADGTVHFRLWAPKASSVDLILSERESRMSQTGEGWFELVSEAHPGAQYQFKIDGEQQVQDPASRFQPSGVHGPSEVIDPLAFEWQNADWKGRPWEEAVIYELHVGTFSPEGTFAGAEKKLDYLAELGVTAVEIMPVSSFAGDRNWGYDGVLPYAPAPAYGRPEDFKHFIDASHSRGLMVFLDVVYNHFGPEGNYLYLYAPQFFTDRHHTPWGQAINFDGPCSWTVRDYFIHNALYWLQEYRLDGLRFDAVHAINDDSNPDILTELAQTVRENCGDDRQIHLVLENDNNAAHYLRPRLAGRSRFSNYGTSALYTAQWNDDVHHAAHVLLTGEKDGYYSDYSPNPIWHLGRCLAEGFSYQGEPSPYRHGELRGEPSRDLPPGCFVSFLQNHDQVGNRAFGERITHFADWNKVKVALTTLLLAPMPPLLFMGEEFAASTPFLFFCDFGPDLAAKVTEGRRSEFARFAQFRSAEAQARIPDPNSPETFLRSKLDWASVQTSPHIQWLEKYRELLACRRREIVPLSKKILPGKSNFRVLGTEALSVTWCLNPSGSLQVIANFGTQQVALPKKPNGRLLYSTAEDHARAIQNQQVAGLSAAWFLNA